MRNTLPVLNQIQNTLLFLPEVCWHCPCCEELARGSELSHAQKRSSLEMNQEGVQSVGLAVIRAIVVHKGNKLTLKTQIGV